MSCLTQNYSLLILLMYTASCSILCLFFIVWVYLWLIPLSHGYLSLNNSQREMFSFCLILSVFLFFLQCCALFARVCKAIFIDIEHRVMLKRLNRVFHLLSDVLCVCCLIWLHRLYRTLMIPRTSTQCCSYLRRFFFCKVFMRQAKVAWITEPKYKLNIFSFAVYGCRTYPGITRLPGSSRRLEWGIFMSQYHFNLLVMRFNVRLFSSPCIHEKLHTEIRIICKPFHSERN